MVCGTQQEVATRNIRKVLLKALLVVVCGSQEQVAAQGPTQGTCLWFPLASSYARSYSRYLHIIRKDTCES